MQLLDGKKTSEDIKQEIAAEVQKMKANGEKVPHLAAVLVGNNGASLTYVGSKVRSCEQIGFESTLVSLPETITENELLAKIADLNEDDNLDGFIVQLPLPKHINEEKILMAIHPDKDVDGFHPANFGKMALEMETFLPATPFGIMELLDRYKVETAGKHTVVIGRSHIVGRPMSILLSSNIPQGNCTVTLCHSHTTNLKEICAQADIIVAALGAPNFVTRDMIKPGAVVIDVGITRVDDPTAKKGFRIKGDVNYEQACEKASAITPVPGGVGLMTIAGLLKNTMKAYEASTNQ